MFVRTFSRAGLAALIAATAPALVRAAPAEKPMAGRQVHFPNGVWSALPQLGPDGKVRQCVLVAPRQRIGRGGPINTRFSLNISRGSGLAAVIQDDSLPTEEVLDDQAEFVIDDHAFPAVGFPVGTAFVFHPGDAAGALAALAKGTRIRLRSDGAAVDSGTIAINLPAEALNWLNDCSRIFDIPIDRPTDPNAPEMPAPQPRSPKTVDVRTLPPGQPGMSDKQKIEGWDASELRNSDGNIIVCFIRRHYVTGSEPTARRMATFLMVSQKRGFTMMLKDTNTDQPEGRAVEATLKIGEIPFTDFRAEVQGKDEIAIFPQHGARLAAALEGGARATFTSKASDNFEFPVQTSVVPWLRACARRNGIPFEPIGQ